MKCMCKEGRCSCRGLEAIISYACALPRIVYYINRINLTPPHQELRIPQNTTRTHLHVHSIIYIALHGACKVNGYRRVCAGIMLQTVKNWFMSFSKSLLVIGHTFLKTTYILNHFKT